jgi:GNAT superfamily N-acetyltransferase
MAAGVSGVAYGWETLAEIRRDPDLADLLASHYYEIAEDQDWIPMDPAWDVYADMERRGIWYAYLARREGRLIGYIAWFVQGHLHHQRTLFAVDDLFYIHPDERAWLVGKRLILGAEERLREMGAGWVILHRKLGFRNARGRGLDVLFKACGYRPYEERWTKLLPRKE